MSLQMRAARRGPAQGQQFIGALAGWAADKVGGWVADRFSGDGNGQPMQTASNGMPGIGVQVQNGTPLASTGSVRGIFPVTGPQPPGGGSYCPNKSAYWRTDPMTGQPVWIAKGSIWVRRRRRNSMNPRALSRAISRVDGAKKLSKKLGRITIRKACK